MRLQRDDHEVLHAEFAWIGCATNLRADGFAVHDQTRAVFAHGRQMWATRDETHIRASARQLHAQQSTNRSRSEDTDFHDAAPMTIKSHSTDAAFAIPRRRVTIRAYGAATDANS